MLVEILCLLHEISSFLEVLYKKGILENFLKFTGKHKKQSSGGVLSKKVFLKIFQICRKTSLWVPFLNKVAGWNPEYVRAGSRDIL